MDVDRYLTVHRGEWSRLEELTGRLRRSPRSLTRAEQDEFVALHHRVSAQLSFVREFYDDLGLVSELNGLVAGSNAVLYRRTSSTRSALGRFFSITFPAAVWHIRIAVGAAAAALFAPWAIVAIWLGTNERALSLAIDDATRNALVQQDFENYYSSAAAEEFAVRVLVNNIQVSFLAYALGITFGVGTLLILGVQRRQRRLHPRGLHRSRCPGDILRFDRPPWSAGTVGRRDRRRGRVVHGLGAGPARRSDTGQGVRRRRSTFRRGDRRSDAGVRRGRTDRGVRDAGTASVAPHRRRRQRLGGVRGLHRRLRPTSRTRRVHRTHLPDRRTGRRRARVEVHGPSEAAGRLDVEVHLGEGLGEVARRLVDHADPQRSQIESDPAPPVRFLDRGGVDEQRLLVHDGLFGPEPDVGVGDRRDDDHVGSHQER